jgi:metal-responsive CopG/Arc/MetJ family transcriptional regulator
VETVLSIRLDRDLVRLLDEEAARAKVSRSGYVRSVLRASLRQRRANAYDALAAYAGIVDGPADLSTNRKHLKGFGRKSRRRR